MNTIIPSITVGFLPKMKKMNCENLQSNLPLYIDDALSDHERVSIEKHLPTCPLCRQKLSEYRDLRNGLRMISRPVIPADLLNSVRSAVANEIRQPTIQIISEIKPSFTEKISHWLLPYSVGTVAASIFAFFLFTFILSGTSNIENDFVASSEKPNKSSVLLAKATPKLTLPEEYERISITDYHPEVNPTGALVELTKSFVRGNIENEEVVVVADVFGNGLAKINEFVEPPSNEKGMDELQKAFESNSDGTPFLPTDPKKANDSVRIILKIHRVDVPKLP